MTTGRKILMGVLASVLFFGPVGAATAQVVIMLGGPPRPQHNAAAQPSPPPNTGAGKRVVYSNSQQRVWLVESNGQVVRSYKVSGRKGVPAPGRYQVFSRSHTSTSASGSLRLDYMVRFAHGSELPIGFHAIPVDKNGRQAQSDAELGQYRSAGCVRQSRADAVAMWNFGQIGIPVIVT